MEDRILQRRLFRHLLEYQRENVILNEKKKNRQSTKKETENEHCQAKTI